MSAKKSSRLRPRCWLRWGLGIEFTEAHAGFEYFKQSGNAIPDATLAEIEACGVALFGATSSPSTKVDGYRSPILAMRKAFDLYANLRPVQSLPGKFSRPNLDLLIVRENTEGLYAGRERLEGDTAIAERVITRKGSTRIVRMAFEQARKRSGIRVRSSVVTVVHKANVLKGDGRAVSRMRACKWRKTILRSP